MKHVKYIVLLLFMFLNINLLFCQQNLFNSILDKVEKNVEKNYYTDSISAVRHSYSSLIKGEYMSEQKKNEFRQFVEYWAGGTIVTESYIITKNNFAVLSFSSEYQQPSL